MSPRMLFKVILAIYGTVISILHCSKSQKKLNFVSESTAKIEPSNFLSTLYVRRTNVTSLRNSLNVNLNAIIGGCQIFIDAVKVNFYEFVESLIKHNAFEKNEADASALRLYSLFRQFKLIAEIISKGKESLPSQISNMRFLQFLLTEYWKKESIDDFSKDKKIFDEAAIESYYGYSSPRIERERASLFVTKILNTHIEQLKKTMNESENTAIFSYLFALYSSILLQRVVVANIQLYSIESISFHAETSVQTSEVVDATLEDDSSFVHFYEIGGGGFLDKRLPNITYSLSIVSYFIDDRLNMLQNIGISRATSIIDVIMCQDLREFQRTGNPSTIVSRNLLQVLEKRKNTKCNISLIIIEAASQKFEQIDNLTYPEKRQKFVPVAKAKKALKPAKATVKPTVNKKGKDKKFQKQQPIRKKAIVKPLNLRSCSEEESDDVDGASDEDVIDVVKLKSTKIDPSANFLMIGQFCYENVLYRLLEELAITECTWKELSEACFTQEGFEALAKLNLTQSQVDVCIGIVRNRVPFAHPNDFSEERVQDDLAILKGQHPEMANIFDEFRQMLSSTTGWSVVPGTSTEMLQAVPIKSEEALSALLRVAEFCWKNVVEPMADNFGLDIYTNTLTEIIEHAKLAGGVDVRRLKSCRSIIKLRNRYAHRAVSAKEARQALLAIYGQDAVEVSVLEPILARERKIRSKILEFY